MALVWIMGIEGGAKGNTHAQVWMNDVLTVWLAVRICFACECVYASIGVYTVRF